MNNQGLVAAFHRATDQPVKDYPQIPEHGRTQLRARLLREEAEEAIEAAFELLPAEGANHRRLCNVAKELADVLYVAYGWANEYGIDLDVVFAEVHKSNMSKAEDPERPRREDGKVLKGPGYREPDIPGALGFVEGNAEPLR